MDSEYFVLLFWIVFVKVLLAVFREEKAHLFTLISLYLDVDSVLLQVNLVVFSFRSCKRSNWLNFTIRSCRVTKESLEIVANKVNIVESRSAVNKSAARHPHKLREVFFDFHQIVLAVLRLCRFIASHRVKLIFQLEINLTKALF
jgi:hypothetical protein